MAVEDVDWMAEEVFEVVLEGDAVEERAVGSRSIRRSMSLAATS